jgi:hypothetical protein
MNTAVAVKEIRVLRLLFGLFALFSCSAVNAGLIRYDVGFDEANIGSMFFDADVGTAGQNLWGSLVDWNLSWSGVEFTSSNSTAASDSLFVVDEAGVVTQDVEEILIFPCGNRFCPEFVPTKYPLFSGTAGTSLGFFNSPFLTQSVLLFDDGTGKEVSFGASVYSGPSAVSAPSALWLLASAISVLGVFRRKSSITLAGRLACIDRILPVSFGGARVRWWRIAAP